MVENTHFQSTILSFQVSGHIFYLIGSIKVFKKQKNSQFIAQCS